MPLRNKLSDALFRLLVGAVYAYALSRVILSATILEVDGIALLRLCLGLSAVWCVLLWGRWSFLAGLGLLALVTGGALLSLYRQEFEARWWLDFSALARELYLFAQDQLPYQPEYSALFGKGLALLLTLLAALNLRVGTGFYALVPLAGITCSVPLYMGWGVDESALALLALCLLALLVHKLNLIAVLRNQHGEKSGGAFALLLLPLCAAVFLLAGSAPKPDVETIREQGLPDVSGAADNLLHHLLPDQIFSWSDDGEKLGGPRSPNDVFVMEVTAPERLYLAGSVRDTYTGDAWKKSRRGDTPLTAEDSGSYSANAYGDLQERQLYWMRYYAQAMGEVTVLTGEARTKSIFSPAFVQSLILDGITPAIDDYGMLIGDKPLPKGHLYTQSYIAWDYSNPYLQQVLRDASRAGQNPRDSRMEACLALPDTLPQRVRELALSLTEGLDNDYDKLLAIQQYLFRFPYTLEPENVPAGEDFVDYFLFTGKEGYCVYFATAMAALGRCAAIPTRYLEGFVLPEQTTSAGSYHVTNQQAHAWVEAWFPDFGWVRFEPTPPAGAGARPEPDLVPEPEPPESEPPEPSQPESPPPAAEKPSEPEPSHPEEKPPAPPDGENSGSEKPPAKGGGLWGLGILLLLAAGSFLWIRRKVNRYRQEMEAMQALPHREAAVIWFGRILGVTAALGCPIQPGETALTYAERAERTLSTPEEPLELQELAEIFCLASYSGREISEFQRIKMKACFEALEARLHQSLPSKLRCWRDRYLLGRW